MRPIAALLIAGLAAVLAASSCSMPPREPDRATLEAEAAARIQAIPAADPEKYRKLRDMKSWPNPYLIVRVDGVGVLDAANHEQRLIKPEELPQVLAGLPSSAWPYGRVVVVAVNGVASSEEDKIRIRKNRALVAGTLESLHVIVNWVPSA